MTLDPVRRWLVAALAVPVLAPMPQQQPRYVERVDVSRVLIDARVVDGGGRPVRDLGVDDFAVKIGGRTAPIESVEWVTGNVEAPSDSALESTDIRATPLSDPRLIVFVFQKSMERERIRGLMRMLIELRSFVGTFSPTDRVAVLSFDSRLNVWLDFTNDMADVRTVLERGILLERPGPVQQGLAPSLLARLDLDRARRAANIEKALHVIGEALEPLPGAKSVVLVGHGFGYLTRIGVTMANGYDEASEALQRARASVFCLDVTEADYHSLELGLQTVADDTGGFFERTHIFTAKPLERLAGALEGHYVLFVEAPDLRRGTHRIDVKLTRAKGKVMARNSFVG